MGSFQTLIELAGSVALLLFGLSLIREGMDVAFGLRMKMILGFGTRTQPRAFLAGLVATLGLQSSTATALLTASFIKRSMIEASMAQMVLIGANVGTALTALILSAGLGALAPGLVLLGYILHRRRGALLNGIGSALIGVGLMLISLSLLETATAPIRDSTQLAALLPLLADTPVLALAIAAGIALLCSSSLAAVLLVLSLSLSPALTVVMVLGANIGGAIPAVLATSGDGPGARRLTLGNLILRGIGCLIALPFATLISSSLSGLPFPHTGLAVEAHLAFNLVLSLVAWPFVGLLTRILAQMIPDEELPESSRTQWLDDSQLETPALALAGASREVLAIGDLVERMINQTMTAFRKTDTSYLAEVTELEQRVDRAQQEVKNYLSRLGTVASEEERRRAIGILDYVINLEHIGDIVEKGLVPSMRKKVSYGLRFSPEGYDELDRMFLMTQENMRMGQTVFMTRDRELARRMAELKVEIRNFEKQSARKHLLRLRDGSADSRESSSLHLDILRDLKRINAHAVSAAYPILDEEGLLIESRLRARGAEDSAAKADAADRA